MTHNSIYYICYIASKLLITRMTDYIWWYSCQLMSALQIQTVTSISNVVVCAHYRRRTLLFFQCELLRQLLWRVVTLFVSVSDCETCWTTLVCNVFVSCQNYYSVLLSRVVSVRSCTGGFGLDCESHSSTTTEEDGLHSWGRRSGTRFYRNDTDLLLPEIIIW